MEVFHSGHRIGDINPKEIYLLPPPPPKMWMGTEGTAGVLVDDHPHVRDSLWGDVEWIGTGEMSDGTKLADNATCSSAATPCLNGGVCSDWTWLDLRRVFSDGYGCVCQFEYGGHFCELQLYEEVVVETQWSPGIYNLTLSTVVPHGGRSLRWSELTVWDTDECAVDNGGCGNPHYSLCINMCAGYAICVDSRTGANKTASDGLIALAGDDSSVDTGNNLSLSGRRLQTFGNLTNCTNCTNSTILDFTSDLDFEASTSANCGQEQSEVFWLKTNMSNPAEFCSHGGALKPQNRTESIFHAPHDADTGFMPDICAREGQTFRYAVALFDKPESEVELTVWSTGLPNRTTIFTPTGTLK
jgi:hypothetical protein